MYPHNPQYDFVSLLIFVISLMFQLFIFQDLIAFDYTIILSRIPTDSTGVNPLFYLTLGPKTNHYFMPFILYYPRLPILISSFRHIYDMFSPYDTYVYRIQIHLCYPYLFAFCVSPEPLPRFPISLRLPLIRLRLQFLIHLRSVYFIIDPLLSLLSFHYISILFYTLSILIPFRGVAAHFFLSFFIPPRLYEY